jgi:glycosyltransferase involved in cell wall biosynthesis
MQFKVAVNSTSLLTPMTGVGRYTYNLCSALIRENNCQIGFLYGTSWSNDLLIPETRFQYTIEAGKKFFPAARSIRRLIQIAVLRRKLKKEKFDLYHEPNFLPLTYDLPVIATIHDLSVMRYPECHPAARVRLFDKYMKTAVERSQYLIADSEYVRHEIIDTFGIDQQKVITTLLGVEKRFHPHDLMSAQALMKLYRLRYKSFFLVVSTLEPRKNLKLVIDAYSRLPHTTKANYPLVIAGMSGWKMSGFKKEIEQLQSKGYLRMLGYIDDESLPIIYSSALSFIYPSRYEGFGLPPLEAMACGTPVITSNASSLPEVVGDAGILVSPDDDIGLSEVMTQMVDDPELVEALSSKSISRSKQFTWEKCARDTIEVYRRL